MLALFELLGFQLNSPHGSIHTAIGGFHGRVGDASAVSANVQGDTVAITYANGQVKIYKCSTGSFQRTL